MSRGAEPLWVRLQPDDPRVAPALASCPSRFRSARDLRANAPGFIDLQRAFARRFGNPLAGVVVVAAPCEPLREIREVATGT